MFTFLRKNAPHRRQASSWRISRWWWPDSQQSLELSLLRIMSIAQQERLPIEPLVRNLAVEHRGLTRRSLLHLANLLSTKPVIVAALEQTPNLVSDPTVLALRHAEQSGLTKPVLEELLQVYHEQLERNRSNVTQSLMYGIVLLLITFLTVSFLVTFISPTLREMFEEFGLALPHAFMTLERVLAGVSGWIPAILIGGVLLCVVGAYFKPQRVFRRHISSRVYHAVAQQRVAELLRMLACVVDAGRPLVGSLSTLGRYHFDASVRNKVLYARNEIEQGLDPWQGLYQAKLLSLEETQALSKASSDALRAWMLRQMSNQYERRLAWRRQLLRNLIHPCMIVVFGVSVAWITLAYFGVLVSMISALT